MNIKTYITNWMQKMIVDYPWISFKYEYSSKRKIHYIGVYPQTEVETNEAYCNAENLFAIDLESKYPEQIVLFGSHATFSKFTDDANCFSGCLDKTNVNFYELNEELNAFSYEMDAISKVIEKSSNNPDYPLALAA